MSRLTTYNSLFKKGIVWKFSEILDYTIKCENERDIIGRSNLSILCKYSIVIHLKLAIPKSRIYEIVNKIEMINSCFLIEYEIIDGLTFKFGFNDGDDYSYVIF